MAGDMALGVGHERLPEHKNAPYEAQLKLALDGVHEAVRMLNIELTYFQRRTAIGSRTPGQQALVEEAMNIVVNGKL